MLNTHQSFINQYLSVQNITFTKHHQQTQITHEYSSDRISCERNCHQFLTSTRMERVWQLVYLCGITCETIWRRRDDVGRCRCCVMEQGKRKRSGSLGFVIGELTPYRSMFANQHGTRQFVHDKPGRFDTHANGMEMLTDGHGEQRWIWGFLRTDRI